MERNYRNSKNDRNARPEKKESNTTSEKTDSTSKTDKFRKGVTSFSKNKFAREERPEKTDRTSKNESDSTSSRDDYRINNRNIFNEGLQLEGRNAILEALDSDRDIDKIWIKKGEVEGTLRVIKSKARDRNIVVQEVNKSKLDEIAMTHNHQGVIAMCPAQNYVEINDILDVAKERGEDPFVLILDGVTDTHNLGAIIRSANAAGVHGIIIPKRRAAGLTGIVSKTSAGSLQHMKIAKVTNISRTVEELQKKGLWIFCGTMDGKPCFDANLKGAIGIVIGDEGEGVSPLVASKCDYAIKIPMYGEISSLNVSVAASVLMYEVVRQRNFIKMDK